MVAKLRPATTDPSVRELLIQILPDDPTALHAGGTSDVMFVEERCLRGLKTYFFCGMYYHTSFQNLEVLLSHHTKFCENRSADSVVEIGVGRFGGRSMMIS